MFDSSRCDNMTHSWNFLVHQEFLASQGSDMHSNYVHSTFSSSWGNSSIKNCKQEAPKSQGSNL
jgi:hypothetical protein